MGGQSSEAQNQVLMKLRIQGMPKFPAVVVSHRQKDLDELHSGISAWMCTLFNCGSQHQGRTLVVIEIRVHTMMMEDIDLSNFTCGNCRAKLLLKRRKEPRRRRE